MVIRMRANRSHRDNRRAHFALKGARFSVCPDCKHKHLSHRICENCGKYNGRVVIDVAAKIAKVEKRKKEKAKAVGK